MKTFAIISLVVFAGFILLGIKRFGLLRSYSAFASKWDEAVPIKKMNLWSIVTLVVAFLLMIPMIDAGDGNKWQFLGFFAPVYLAVVAFTPKFETDPKQHKIHVFGASACALIASLWLVLVQHLWWVALISLAVMAAAAYFTKTWKTSYIFWLEMTLFAAVYAAVIFF